MNLALLTCWLKKALLFVIFAVLELIKVFWNVIVMMLRFHDLKFFLHIRSSNKFCCCWLNCCILEVGYSHLLRLLSCLFCLLQSLCSKAFSCPDQKEYWQVNLAIYQSFSSFYFVVWCFHLAKNLFQCYRITYHHHHTTIL